MTRLFTKLWTTILLILVFSLPALPATTAQAAEGPDAAAETALSTTRQPETLSAGLNFNCAVQSDGTLACWGKNDYGQATPPVGVFTQVGAGALHTCGLRGDGALVCWGRNNFGQSSPPTGVFIQVSAGGDTTCAVRGDGTLACWGNNNDGQTTAPAGVFTQVSAGGSHTCGLHSDGTLACWGYNNVGQATPPSGVFTQVSAGGYHTCGLRGDGSLACWGGDYYGQATPPTGTFTQVSAGGYHTCGLRSDGTLACWGRNVEGQATPPAGVFTQVSAGSSHTCGLRADGTLACWGSNGDSAATPPAGSFFGQRRVTSGWDFTCGVRSNGALSCWGENGYGQSMPPTGTFTQVSAGLWHTCGVRSNGTLACWGENTYSQATPPAGTFIQVSAGFFHTCGLQSNGMLSCWGNNGFGQAAPPAGEFIQVSADGYHACGLRSNGTLACWGDNSYGQATPPSGAFTQVSAGFYHTCGLRENGTLTCWGDNSVDQSTTPAGAFTQVSSGFLHTCGLRGDGQVLCWGANEDGQATPPVGEFAQVSPGANHTCGIRSNGTLNCWGDNWIGQAPRLSITPASLPDGQVDSAYSELLSPGGGVGPYTFSIASGSLPPGLSLGAGGLISGTPTSSGTFTFTIRLVDSGLLPLSLEQTYSLNISPPPNRAPICQNVSLNTNEDTIGVAAPVCTDADNNPLTYAIADQPAHGSATVIAGQLQYTPASNYNGPDSFTYIANDGELDSAPVTVSVTVAAVNDAPVCQAVSLGTDEDTTGTTTPNCSDVEGDPLTYNVASQPAHGLAAVVGSLLQYTPTSNYNGTDSFSYTASDGSLSSAPAAVSVTVRPANDAPVCQARSINTPEDTVGTTTPNCTDVDGDPLTYSIASQPANGSAMVLSGQLRYTPASNYNGPDSFTYLANDSHVNSAPAVVSVMVTAVNDAPVCRAVALSTNEDMPGTAAPDCTDVDGDSLNYSIASQPTNGSATVAGGQLQYTPASNYNGVDSFTYRASDSNLSSAPATVSVTVRPVNDAPICQGINLNTEEDTIGTVAPHCSDLEGDPLVYSIAEQPAHGAAAVVGGLLQYTPETDYNGLDSFTYRANDGALDSTPATVNVSVGSANDLPTAVDDVAITDEDTPILINVLANDSDSDGGVLSVTSATDPAYGDVELHADGTITYTPQENYYGPDGFSYEISDGQGGTDQAVVVLSVRPVNDAPVAVEDFYHTRYMTSLGIPLLEGLLVNDSDVEGDPLSAVLVSSPAHGQVILNPDGSFTYTPDASATAFDIFTYTATDGAANSAVTIVTIVIHAINMYLPLVMK